MSLKNKNKKNKKILTAEQNGSLKILENHMKKKVVLLVQHRLLAFLDKAAPFPDLDFLVPFPSRLFDSFPLALDSFFADSDLPLVSTSLLPFEELPVFDPVELLRILDPLSPLDPALVLDPVFPLDPALVLELLLLLDPLLSLDLELDLLLDEDLLFFGILLDFDPLAFSASLPYLSVHFLS